jgi:5-methylcytosine-specific restriction endonuclease McrA
LPELVERRLKLFYKEMTMQTLVLNVSYEPVRVIPWQRGIKMICLEKADLVEGYERRARSQRASMPIPAVVRLGRYHKNREQISLQRQYVYARDGWRCCYCGEKFPTHDLTYDHVVPRSKGGKTRWQNIVTSCSPCNGKKGDRTPEEAGMRLLRKPVRPRWMPLVIVKAAQAGNVPEQWTQYINWLIER